MKHYNVTLAEVMNVTRNMNQNANGGVGFMNMGTNILFAGCFPVMMGSSWFVPSSRRVEGAPKVTLEDIADVKIGSLGNPNWQLLRERKPAILAVTKQPKTGDY